MRLSALGELGLLAELERRGLITGVEHDAADLGDGPSPRRGSKMAANVWVKGFCQHSRQQV